MKILILNQNWFTGELRAAGHEVVVAGWAHDAFDVRFQRLIGFEELLAALPDGFQPEVVVYFDDSYSVSVTDLELASVPMVFCSIDIHHHLAWHSWFGNLFEHTLVCQKDYLEQVRPNYLGAPDQLSWFPLWAPWPLEPAGGRDIPASFRGTLDPKLHPVRATFFEALAKLVPIDAQGGPYIEVYCRSKIVVNQSVSLDLNFRVFEAMMAGAMLITPRLENGLLELFEDGKHLRIYESQNVEQAAELVRYYLEHDEERARIAAAGYEEVSRLHSPRARAADILKVLSSLEPRSKPRRFFSAAMTYLHAYSMYRENAQAPGGELIEDRQKLLRALKTNLLKSAEEREGIDEEFRAASLLCKCFLEAAASREEVLAFSSQLCATDPDDFLLRLSNLDDLIATGHREEAAEIARQMSSSPEEFLSQLPQVMLAAKTQVLASIKRH